MVTISAKSDRKGPQFISRLQMKYAVIYMLIIAVVLVLMNTYPVVSFRNMVFKSKETTLVNNALIISTALAGLGTLTDEGVSQVVSVVGGSGGYEIVIWAPSGETLYYIGDGFAVPDTQAAMAGMDTFRSRYTDKEGFVSIATVPVMSHGSIIGGVAIRETDAEQGNLLATMQSNLSSISFLIVLLTLGMSIAISALMSMRMNDLLRNIKNVRLGHYSMETQIKGNDEVAQLSREFEELTERLRKDEQERRRFISDASHELKTPIAAIRLLSDSICHSPGLDVGTAREFAVDISEQAERLAKLAENMLTLTRQDERVRKQKIRINLSGVITGCIRALRPLAQENRITFTTNLANDCAVLGDKDEVNLIVFNLLENAIKYNVPGGSVDVTLGRAGDNVLFSVEDTGIGIPNEDKDKIFQRFYRVDKARARQRGGSGIGLSIVHGAVEAMGGKITVSDGAVSGTRFAVLLPAAGEGRGSAG